MNKVRRSELYSIVNRIEKWQMINNHYNAELNKIKIDLQWILNEEENYRDNIPENMQGGYKYQCADEACDNLESAISCLEDIEYECDADEIKQYLTDSINYINNATI